MERIGRFARRVVSAIKERIAATNKRVSDEELLLEWQQIFEYDYRKKKEWSERFDDWEAMYHGNRVFENVNRTQQKLPRTQVNFIRMIIESQLDLNVPQPMLKPVASDDESSVEALQSQVDYCVRAAEPSLEEINLITERGIRKFGTALIKVHWNNQIRRAGYVGDVELSVVHVKDFIPNVGATSIEDLEHYHHVVNQTERYILRRWPKLTAEELAAKANLYEEFDEMASSQDIPILTGDTPAEETGLRRYSIVETTYRDEDGDIGKLWWSGDILIEHLPKFFYRRDVETGKPVEAEMVRLSDTTGAEQAVEVPYYVPRRWDVAYGVYIPRDKCFWGVSMMEDMKDLSESIKKLVYILEEKILRGTKKIVTSSEGVKNKLLDPLSEVIVLDEFTKESITELDFTGNWELETKFLLMMKDFLQLITGATNPSLGQETSDVTSGRQAQMYISQAGQMTDKTTAARNAMYRRLYRIIADFYLAFADYARPWRLQGANGQNVYGTYDRLSMLRDQNGNLVYPDYDVEVSAEAGFMRHKTDIVNMVTMLANGGRFEPSPANLMVLTILDRIGVPQLKDAIGQMEQQLGVAQQMQTVEGLVQMFASLPDEQKLQVLQALQQIVEGTPPQQSPQAPAPPVQAPQVPPQAPMV